MKNGFLIQDITASTLEVCAKIAATPSNLQPLPIQSPTPEPAPTPLKPTEWAKKHFQFQPSPKQAEVIDSTAKYLMLCCNRQWGKTTAMAVKAMYHAVHTPNLNIVVMSRSKEQAGLLIGRATEFAIGLGMPVRRVLGQPFSLKLPNGSQIAAVPHNTTSSLGRSAQILIVDEASVVTDEVYYSVSPFVSRTHGQIWLLATPKRQSGFFYNAWHDLAQEWHRVFANVLDCPEIDPKFLEIYRRASPTQYAQDYLCEFIQPSSRLTTRGHIETVLRKRKPKP